jgi:hypothetical protein
MGTADDRYAGWLGQIYTKECYQGRIGQSTKVVKEHTFTEEVLAQFVDLCGAQHNWIYVE